MPRNKLTEFDRQLRHEISSNLKKYTANITQGRLSELTGIPASTISGYFAERSTPSPDQTQKIADALGVSKGDIDPRFIDSSAKSLSASISSLKNVVPIEKRMIPVIGTIAAGKPILADEHIETYVPCDIDIHADFGLIIHGDSMIDAGINDGDVVFIKKQPVVEDGQIAAVRIDDDATLKRFYKSPDGCTLISANPKYAPMVFNSSNCDKIEIIGLAVAKYAVIKQ